MSEVQVNAEKNNIMATAMPNVTAERLADFSKIRTYAGEQKDRDGLLQLAPLSLYAKIGFGFSNLKKNVNGKYYLSIQLPGVDKPTQAYVSTKLQLDDRLKADMPVNEIASFVVLSRNESVDKETGLVTEYLRLERKANGINTEATKALAELGY
jgi:hypothetical protein